MGKKGAKSISGQVNVLAHKARKPKQNDIRPKGFNLGSRRIEKGLGTRSHGTGFKIGVRRRNGRNVDGLGFLDLKNHLMMVIDENDNPNLHIAYFDRGS